MIEAYRLRDSPDDLEALVDGAALHFRLPQAFVEKDFWVAEVLRAAVKDRVIADKSQRLVPVTFVFKGGTSLSRAYNLIERFSEDVDLLVVFPENCSPGAKDKILKAVCHDVGEHLGIDPQDRRVSGAPTKGVKRHMRYHYPGSFESGVASEGVLLEMGTRGGDFPLQVHRLRSMVADYAVGVLGELESAWQEFEPFTVNVLSPERTLLEKISAVHDAVSRMPDATAHNALMRGGRHFYDIHRLLSNADVLQLLTGIGPDGSAGLIEDIDAHSAAAGFSFTPRPDGGYAHSPAFQPTPDLLLEMEKSYELATGLIYGEQPSLTDCLTTVQKAAHLL